MTIEERYIILTLQFELLQMENAMLQAAIDDAYTEIFMGFTGNGFDNEQAIKAKVALEPYISEMQDADDD